MRPQHRAKDQPGGSSGVLLPLPQGEEGSRIAATVESLLEQTTTRWAYAIHDGLTQSVTAAILQLEGMQRMIREEPETAIAMLGECSAGMRAELDEIRSVLFELSVRGEDSRLDQPLRTQLSDIGRPWGMTATLHEHADIHRHPESAQAAAILVMREALINAAKHAGCSTATVTVREDDHDLVIQVSDEGCGIPTGTPAEPERHFGMRMMLRRVTQAGGTLHVDSTAGRGTRVTARFPSLAAARRA